MAAGQVGFLREQQKSLRWEEVVGISRKVCTNRSPRLSCVFAGAVPECEGGKEGGGGWRWRTRVLVLQACFGSATARVSDRVET